MRILFFAGGGDTGGGKTHILSLAKELSSENDVRLLSFRESDFSDEAVRMGIDTIIIDHKKGYPFAAWMAVKLTKQFSPDIIHSHGAKANVLGIIAGRRLNIPVMTTVHSDPELDYMGNALRQHTIGKINILALKHMDYYVAVAGKMKELLIKRGFDPLKIYTIFNGLDFSGSENNPHTESANGIINIGIAARLTAVKDISTLIKAFAAAFKKNNSLRLRIAGDGEEEDRLKALAEELGVSSYVSFVGWVSDMKSFFKDIDINVLSSLSETFPYSLLEGAYEHCPAIASNAGGIPYLIEHEKTGLLFECRDDKTLAEYILRLAESKAERDRLAEALYTRASEDYSLSKMKACQQYIYGCIFNKIRRKNDAYGVILCGAYGRGNAGDEALLKALKKDLRSFDGDIPIYVMSKNPMETKLKEEVGSFDILDVFTLKNKLKKTQLFISGGGSLIQDITSSRSLYYYLYTLWAAKKAGCRTLMYGCGIGPINSPLHRRLAAKVMNSSVDVITLRDMDSFKLLSSMGVDKPEIILSADPAFGLEPASETEAKRALDAIGVPEGKKLLGLCIREWKGFAGEEAVARACGYAYEKYGLIPVFIPFEIPKDVHINKRILSMIDAGVPKFYSDSFSDSLLVSVLGKTELVIGMRLHSLIFAVSAGTAVIGISYDRKIDGFMKEIGNSAVVRTENVTEEILKKYIDDMLQINKDAVCAAGERLRLSERKNAQAAINLLKQ